VSGEYVCVCALSVRVCRRCVCVCRQASVSQRRLPASLPVSVWPFICLSV